MDFVSSVYPLCLRKKKQKHNLLYSCKNEFKELRYGIASPLYSVCQITHAIKNPFTMGRATRVQLGINSPTNRTWLDLPGYRDNVLFRLRPTLNKRNLYRCASVLVALSYHLKLHHFVSPQTKNFVIEI